MRRTPEKTAAAVKQAAVERPEGTAFWAAGKSTQDDEGHLHMKTVLAIGHQPDRTFFRAAQAAMLHQQVYTNDGTDQVCVMPVHDRDAQAITDRLRRRAAKASPLLARAARMGLGQDATIEASPVPLDYQTTPTHANGKLTEPLADEAYAEMDRQGRLHGRIDAGEPTTKVHQEDDRPGAWAAGFSFADFITERNPDLPTIPEVLAIADDAVTAMRRAAWMARHDEKTRKRYLEDELAVNAMTLKAVPITRTDADAVTELLENATTDSPELIRTAIGGNPEADNADIDELIGRKAELPSKSDGGDAPPPEGPPRPGTRFATVSVLENGTIYIP